MHTVQVVALSAELADPAVHGTQWVALYWCVPGAHGSHNDDILPSTSTEEITMNPEGQLLHADAPAAEYVPSGHAEHWISAIVAAAAREAL